MKYNQSNYRNIFKDVPVEYSELHASEVEPSLSECIQKSVFGLTLPSQLQNAFTLISDQIHNMSIAGGLNELQDWKRMGLTSQRSSRE